MTTRQLHVDKPATDAGEWLMPPGDLRTDSVETFLCAVEPGAEHDFRPHTYQHYNAPHTSWVCVWCNGVACGNYGDPDPCWRVYHHVNGHRSRSGVEWPLGGTRPDRPWS